MLRLPMQQLSACEDNHNFNEWGTFPHQSRAFDWSFSHDTIGKTNLL